MQAGRTIAVDPRMIPLGSKIRFGDRVYTAEDTGETIKGKRIDLYVKNHEQAMRFGKKLIAVYKEE
jgi:3D (Asp-Asp-Asp) domain-containing protein